MEWPVQLEQQFTIPIGIDQAWSGLLDIQRVASAFPGATLATHTDDSFTGTVKVKLGPVGLTYRGEAKFTEIDQTAHRVALVASGTDIKGNGNASAAVHAVLSKGSDDSTVCDLQTHLEVTGKAAQFGRGIVVDIGNRVLSQFARNLEKSFREPVTAQERGAATADSPAASPSEALPIRGVPTATDHDSAGQDSLDALDLLWSSPVGRRVVVSLGAFLSLLLMALVLRRRDSRS
jgi:uncharacterized protein